MPYSLSPEPCSLYPPTARHYNSALSIWLSVDPMADKYPSTSPYTYCANNPVRLVDPNGEDWVERIVNGQKEVYYDRTVKSQADVNRKYGEKAGVRYLADGSKVGNGQYTVYNDHQYNKNGIIFDSKGNQVDPDRTIIYGNNYRIFAGVTDKSVNAESLHKNLMGTSYTGGNNPQSYNQKENYDYIPSNLSELFSMIHDKQYDNLGAAGIKGALFQTNTWKADFLLAASNAISIPLNPNYTDKTRSAVTAVVFGFIGTYKMIGDSAKKCWNFVKKTCGKNKGN